MGDEPVRAALALGETNQLTADAEASVVGIRDEHPELARAVIEALHADRADDPVAQAGDGDLAGARHLGDLAHRRAGRALGPQAVLGHRVDLVREVSDPFHHGRVVARGRRQELDLDARGRGAPGCFRFALRLRHGRPSSISLIGPARAERLIGRGL